jgi:PAS domain S-box-containing protein
MATPHTGRPEEVPAVSFSSAGDQPTGSLGATERDLLVREALVAAGTGTWYVDLRTGQAFWDEIAQRTLGFGPGILDGRFEVLLGLSHPDDVAVVLAALATARETHSNYVENYRLRRPDGDERWISSRGRFFYDEAGTPIRAAGTLTDVTERKAAELALRQSEELFRTLSEGAPIGIFQLNAAGGLTYANPPALAMTGLDLVQALGDGWRRAIHPDDGERLIREIGAFHLSTTRSFAVDFRFRQQSGRVTWVHGRAARLASESGEQRGYVGTLEDITVQVEAEAERERLRAQLDQAQKLESLGVLAGGIAHDMNNLLVPILGNASLARADAAGTELEPALADIETAANRAAELTRQLLAYAGKGRFAVNALDLSAIARDVAESVRSSLSANATLEVDLAEQLPAIQGDGPQLKQVLLNLLTNAAEALDGGAGMIRIATGVARPTQAERSSTYFADDLIDDECVFLEVSDTGSGMTPETVQRIFDPFFTTKFTGRGLGLAATLGVLRGHRAGVRVQSTVGQGSVFRMLFPLSDRVALAAALTPAEATTWRATGSILIVDDEPAVRTVAARVAERAGLTVLQASNGKEALEVYEQHADAIRLVLLDLSMPIMGGEEVASELARLAPGVRIVLTSGYAEHDIRSRIGHRGIMAFVGKPFVRDELIAAFRTALET